MLHLSELVTPLSLPEQTKRFKLDSWTERWAIRQLVGDYYQQKSIASSMRNFGSTLQCVLFKHTTNIRL